MKDSQHARPLWLGFLAASLTPAACVVVYAVILEDFSVAITDLIKIYLLMSIFAFPVSAITLLIIALPLVLWLKRTKRLSAITISAGAILAGSLSLALVTWASVWNNPVPGPKEFAIGALLGLVSGIVFSIAAGLTIRSSRHRFAASAKPL
jgi:hypothetical protein